MATGHEDRFRQLFAQESETRLSRITEQLLAIEEHGADDELVGGLFREAHTLKGGAAVVGFADVARVAHAVEDVLEEVRARRYDLGSQDVDVLLGAVDTLRALVAAGIAGIATTADADASEQRLRALLAGTPDAARPDPAPAVPAAAEPAPQRSAASDAETETIRLPLARLDELARLVTEAATAHLRIGTVLAAHLRAAPADLPEFRELGRVLDELQDKTTRARMVPVATLAEPLHRAVRDLARGLGKQVRWELRGGDTELDRGVLDQLADPLLHLVRNAVDHGVEPPAERVEAGKPEVGVVRLHAMRLGSEVVLAVADDGRGIDADRVAAVARERGVDLSGRSDDDVRYAIFSSGLSTATAVSNVSGRGVGLDVVRAVLERIRGRVEVRSEVGAGAEFRIIVPMTLTVVPCVLVAAAGQRFALPLHSVVAGVAQEAGDEQSLEGRPVVRVDGRTVPIAGLAETLGIASGDGNGHVDGSARSAVVVGGLTRLHAFRVDAVLGQRRVVVKGLSRLLPRLDVVAGASVEPDGSVLVVLDPPGLIEAARTARRAPRVAAASATATDEAATTPATTATVLVVDDALTVRELQRTILERAGYEVVTAADGADALARLSEHAVQLVLTDVEMPRMDGFALVEAIRARRALAGLPVVILSSRGSEEDRRRGLDAGADAYVAKSAFDAAALLSTVERLLGVRP
jgi:two-component system chemotaxis sensor kinase CheA